MRRGLMGWNADELPLSILHARLERLRTMMQQEGLDAFLLYTNMVRPAAVTHLTGFTPYWSDAIVLILRDGPPILATALSKRVAGWIRSTGPETEIVNAPKPGTAIGARLAAAAVKRTGVLELDAFPSAYHDELVGAAPTVELIDASASFASRRLTLDTAERNLLGRADALAVSALDQVNIGSAEDAGSVAGLVEHHARMSGAEEIFVAVAPDLVADRRLIRVTRPIRLATRFAVRVSVAYKGAWIRRMRSFTKNGSEAFSATEAWFAQVVEGIEPGQALAAQLAAHLHRLPGAALLHWSAEASIGGYPLQVVANARQPETHQPMRGGFYVLTAQLSIDRASWLGAAPAFIADN